MCKFNLTGRDNNPKKNGIYPQIARVTSMVQDGFFDFIIVLNMDFCSVVLPMMWLSST